MNTLTIDDLINVIKKYNPEEVEIIKKAYYYAEELHKGQKRQSGEDYITHPLNVAYILASMHADRDTVCAGLLHDTLEDTHITKEDISHDFNPVIASLVDGVTKISKLNFSTKQEQNLANTRKIITGITSDVRIIIIKLADRLHNMRTLEYKTEFKQKENSLETIDIFVPLAYYIGAYRIKSELEDLSFRYLKPDIYMNLLEKNKRLEEENKNILLEMKYKIETILKDNNISNEIKVRTKNIYGIYKRLSAGERLSDIHDLFSLKVMVDEIDDCYKTLRYVHNLYHPINSKFKDYKYIVSKNDVCSLDEEEQFFIDLIMRYLGCYSGKALERMTHCEKPWRETRKGLSPNQKGGKVIEKALIESYFSDVYKKYNMLSITDIVDYSTALFNRVL